MRKKLGICVLVTLLLISCFKVSSVAFDANDYGGGSSYSDNYSYDYSNDYSYSSSSSSSGGSLGLDELLVYAAFMVILYLLLRFMKPRRGQQTGGVRPSSGQGQHIQLPDRTEQIENVIKQYDPNFSASDFTSFVKRVYIDIQMAWCKRDMTSVRTLLHENLYDATVKQVQAKIDQGVIYHYESMVVNTAYMTSYARDEQFEYLTVYLNARMIDWQADEKTGQLLRGDKETRWDLRYKMKFMRSVGVQTREGGVNVIEHTCPNCGAPLEMASSAKCAYCQSILTTGQYSWVLSDFGTIRNDTIDEGIRVKDSKSNIN